jgi:hypothetical protein
MDDLPWEEVDAVLERTARRLLTLGGVTAPPVDALALGAELFGLEVVLATTAPRRQKRELLTVTLPATAGTEERHLAAARAVAERHKADVLRSLGLEPTARLGLAGGTLMKRLAERILVPSAWFRRAVADLSGDLYALKERFATTSYELLADRWLELTKSAVIACVDDDVTLWRRSNVPRVGKGLAPAELACLAAVRAQGAPAEVNQGGWHARAWPIPRGARIMVWSQVAVDES